MNIFVGNLSFASTEAEVRQLFSGFGAVETVTIVMDKRGMKSRGFGFVLMPDDEQARAAIAALHKKEFMGRSLTVVPSMAKQKKAHRPAEAQGQQAASGRHGGHSRRRFRRGAEERNEQFSSSGRDRSRQPRRGSRRPETASAGPAKPEPFWKKFLKPFRKEKK